MNLHDGGCLCGDIRYRFRGDPVVTSLCHCRSCRLAAGAHAVAWVVVRRADFELVRGVPAEYRSSPEVARLFCGRCGTALAYRHDRDATTIDLTTATLDAPDAFPPSREIWLDHKVGWAVRDPQLPGYRESSRGQSTPTA